MDKVAICGKYLHMQWMHGATRTAMLHVLTVHKVLSHESVYGYGEILLLQCMTDTCYQNVQKCNIPIFHKECEISSKSGRSCNAIVQSSLFTVKLLLTVTLLPWVHVSSMIPSASSGQVHMSQEWMVAAKIGSIPHKAKTL